MLNQSPYALSKYEMLALLGRVSIPMTIEQLAATLAIAEAVATCDLMELQRRQLVVMVSENQAGESFWAARRGQYGGEPWVAIDLLRDESERMRARARLRRDAADLAHAWRRASITMPQR